MTETSASKKGWPWGKIVLFVSLALNLLVVGIVAGALLNGPRDRDRDSALGNLGFTPFMRALPDADRAQIGGSLRREGGGFRENRDRIRESFDAFLTALRAEPFEAAQLRQIVDGQQVRVTERLTLGSALLLERIEAMETAERLAYADTLEQSLRRGPRGRGWRSERW